MLSSSSWSSSSSRGVLLVLLTSRASTVSRLLSRGGILANIDGAPLYLTGYAMEHPFTSRSDLLDRIAKHYISSAIREFHKVLGSADFLGSPLSFLRTMGTGVHDFIAEPARGLQKSPTEFGVGLLKGTQSLVKNSGYGVFNSVAKLTGTLGKGAAELTFDREYLRERETLNREKAHHIGEGLAYGFRDLGLGIFQGIGGVVVRIARCGSSVIIKELTIPSRIVYYVLVRAGARGD